MGGDLDGVTPAASYKDLLQIDHSNQGVDATLRNVETGEGTATVLQLSTAAMRATSALWYSCRYIPAVSAAPGASGATLVPPDANSVGGYQLDANTEYLYLSAMACSDWDAASDILVIVTWECNVANGGGGVDDTVDLQLVCRMKGDAESAIKTQTLEEAVTVGQSARYKQFETIFTIDYNDGSNPVDSGDLIGMALNLETDTSEVDDIIINHIMFRYRTKQFGIEV